MNVPLCFVLKATKVHGMGATGSGGNKWQFQRKTISKKKRKRKLGQYNIMS